MALAQHLERLEDAAEDPRHLGLADAGRAGEHHVLAHGRHRQVLGAALLLHLHPGDDALHLQLHGLEPDHAVEGRERGGQEVLLLRARAVVHEADRADLAARPGPVQGAPRRLDPRRDVARRQQAPDEAAEDQAVAQQRRRRRGERPEHVRPQGDQQAGGTQHDDPEERDRMLVEAFHGRGKPWCWPWCWPW
ncbi:hypothetical protein R1A27_00730 [Methylobacterium sp. NMS12]|uniref:hypothetical protein n=1 Tax=Methylobacterium sp. NMS12 TaxID=3079766 RepID=UPI003F88472B